MLARLVGAVRRRLALDRNPMRRRMDRIATWASALAVLALLATAPFIGARLAAARQSAQLAHAAASPEYRVTATLVRVSSRAAPDDSAGQPATRTAHWIAPDGTRRGGTVNAPANGTNGRTTTIWTDAHGNQKPRPLTRHQIRANASVFGAFMGAAMLFTGIGAIWVAGRLLDRRRYADWDDQWRRVAQRWMRQY